MPAWIRWPLGLTLAASIVAVPLVYYRASYAHSKRLREVTPGRFYRSGQLTERGLREAIERHGIRTVINLQNEARDPELPASYFDRSVTVTESELCRQLGVEYAQLDVDLIPPDRVGDDRPAAIDAYLELLDRVMSDPEQHPVLLHCKAGLHRTGLLAAIYRMEYEGWDLAGAVAELRANGFGDSKCNTDNAYLIQYLKTYRPRHKGGRR